MTSLEVLAGGRVIIELPPADENDLIAGGEVLIQEHLACWTVPHARRDELSGLRRVFGRRVRLGISDLRTPAQVADALICEPDLLLSPFAQADLLAAASGTPLVLGRALRAEIQRRRTSVTITVDASAVDAALRGTMHSLAKLDKATGSAA